MKYLFKYLDKREISIDKKEFEFQLNTHPNGGSLLGISDTSLIYGGKEVPSKLENGACDVFFDENDNGLQDVGECVLIIDCPK